ncbi:MAG: 16S rRNA (cytosine(1402)-N(4))-methyltransferase RsmH [Oscillospiraceae bacterium]|jgi:16S rRNA (cytosine1402-N4)-methyltransferase|nr:16S rRNA (cytosine(1402)-N(4))-methyltransferase RsmH [Oscillospiraceae bacterium]
MFEHKSVLFEESINALNIKPNGIYIDATGGGGGHSNGILSKLSDGLLITLDRDPDAVAVLNERLKGNVKIIQSNYSDIDIVLKDLNIDSVDGVLMDLGVSSYQIDTAERGFSFHNDAPLDMRMEKSGISAYDIVNTFSDERLANIIYTYGEEKFSRKIAANIVKKREEKPIETTLELVEIIRNSVPFAVKRDKNPAKKTFQALRIAVNSEFEHLEKGIEKAFESLKYDGILAVITFHSLEDKIVKHKFLEYCVGCTCPKNFPICVCNRIPKAVLVNRKPILPSSAELEQNSRAHSAKLRVLQKIKAFAVNE